MQLPVDGMPELDRKERGRTGFPMARRLALVCLLLALGAGAKAGLIQQQTKLSSCFGCHSAPEGTTRFEKDPETGHMQDVGINWDRFGHGVHKDVKCKTCHTQGFATYPHNDKKTYTCMGCHPRKTTDNPTDEKADGKERALDFEEWESEFLKTVHYTKYGRAKHFPQHRKKYIDHEERGNFGCEQCHEPHYFQLSEDMGSIKEIVDTHNRWCVRCHSAQAEKTLAPEFDPRLLIGGGAAPVPEEIKGKETKKSPLADPADPGLKAEHSYLPHPGIHLRETRCVECHISNEAPVSHELLVEDAIKGCATCHNPKSVMRKTLYRHEIPLAKAPWQVQYNFFQSQLFELQEEFDPAYQAKPTGEDPPGRDPRRADLGFLNPEILEEGYVMGANRNRPLDWLAYILVGAAFAFVLVHAVLRLLRRRP